MSRVNIFTRYVQEENHFTNALIAVLSMSTFASPDFLSTFLRGEVGLDPIGEFDAFCVLKGIQGTADGELRSEQCCLQFETKIVSGTLRKDQILAHLEELDRRAEKLKRLILLTPDDSHSNYVQHFCSLDASRIVHLGWKRVYAFFQDYPREQPQNLFGQLVGDFLELIRDKVFEQDYVGIILKIDFGKKSEIYEGSYLAELRSRTHWNTPREYKGLDGTGRKLILYDRTRRGVTAEVEIESVERTDEEKDYPWRNAFAKDTLHVFEEPIPLERIRAVDGLKDFGVHRIDRGAFRKITHEQYRQLTGLGTGHGCDEETI